MDVFYAYLDKELSNEALKKFEHHLVDCALCSDALEGFEQLKQSKTEQIVFQINQKINSRTHSPSKIIWLAAATLLFALGLGVYLFEMANQNEKISLNSSEKNETILVPEMSPSDPFSSTAVRVKEDDKTTNFQEKTTINSSIPKLNPKTSNTTFQDVLAQEPIALDINDAQENEFSFSEKNGNVPQNDNIYNKSTLVQGGATAQSSSVDIKELSHFEKPEMLAFTEALLYAEATSLNDNPTRTASKRESKQNKSVSKNDALENASYVSNDYQTGLSYYNNQNFKTALSFFEKAKKDNSKAEIFAILSEIMLQDNEKALIKLELIIANSKHQHYYDALWIKVFLLKQSLKNYQTELILLTQTPNPYAEKAKAMQK